jgi:hypothetical protein
MGDMADFFLDRLHDEEDDYYGTECRYCGVECLEWHEENGKWILREANGTRHKCKKHRVDQLTADDFENLDGE